MKQFAATLLILVLAVLTTAGSSQPAAAKTISTGPKAKLAKNADLVLIHGLANKHKWSESFLKTCLRIWGSGRVFVIYTGPGTTITQQDIQGRQMIFAGEEKSAGTDTTANQVANVKATIQKLQKKKGLSSPFSIIAHSMGGLIARQYSYDNPGTVAGLVTLGTPHHGSPLANSFQWAGFFLGAMQAIEDLKPENVDHFNAKYPAEGTPLALSDTFHTIRGTPDGSDCYGWMGELFIGWQILYRLYGTPNDGLVPYDSARIKGSSHIADFAHYDHYDLVRQPDVAELAAQYLP